MLNLDAKRLGVTVQASDGEIKAAFRKKALRLHPDVSNHPDAHSEFIQLRESYERLLASNSNQPQNDDTYAYDHEAEWSAFVSGGRSYFDELASRVKRNGEILDLIRDRASKRNRVAKRLCLMAVPALSICISAIFSSVSPLVGYAGLFLGPWFYLAYKQRDEKEVAKELESEGVKMKNALWHSGS